MAVIRNERGQPLHLKAQFKSKQFASGHKHRVMRPKSAPLPMQEQPSLTARCPQEQVVIAEVKFFQNPRRALGQLCQRHDPYL